MARNLGRMLAESGNMLDVCELIVEECESVMVHPEEMNPEFAVIYTKAKEIISRIDGEPEPAERG